MIDGIIIGPRPQLGEGEYLLHTVNRWFSSTDAVVAIAKKVVDERNRLREENAELRKTIDESHSKEQRRQKKEQAAEEPTDDCRVCGKTFKVNGRYGVSIAFCSENCREMGDLLSDRAHRRQEAADRLRHSAMCKWGMEGDWHLQQNYYNGKF
jgi:regulator of replication initiation timing